MPPTTLGVFRVPYVGLPGSTRSGLKARKKSSPTVRPVLSSAGSRISRVVPGYVVLSRMIACPRRSAALDRLGRGDDVADVRVLELGERRRHADRDGVRLGQPRHVGGRAESAGLDTACELRVGHVLDVRTAGVEPVDHLWLHVEAEHPVAGLARAPPPAAARRSPGRRCRTATSRRSALRDQVLGDHGLSITRRMLARRRSPSVCCASRQLGVDRQREHLLRRGLRHRKTPLGVAEMREARLEVQRQRIIDRRCRSPSP